MPVAVALVAAYASVSAGVVAGGIIGGLMVTGGLFTAAGALANDRDAMRIGGLLSLAGGIGSMASGSFDQVASEVAQESAASRAVDGTLTTDASFAGSSDIASGRFTMDAAGGAQAGGAAAGVEAAAPAATTQAPSMTPITERLTAEMPGAVPKQAFDSATSQAATAPTVASPTAATIQAPTTASMMPSLEKIGNFIADPKNARLVQTGAGMLQSVGQYYGQKEALREQLAAQEEAQQRARDRYSASVRGLRMPVWQKVGG